MSHQELRFQDLWESVQAVTKSAKWLKANAYLARGWHRNMVIKVLTEPRRKAVPRNGKGCQKKVYLLKQVRIPDHALLMYFAVRREDPAQSELKTKAHHL